MSKRVMKNVARPSPVHIEVNGEAVIAYEGESIATALLAAGHLILSRDSSGRPRSPYCNMGVCFDCMVVLEATDESGATTTGRVRACLTAVRGGQRIGIPRC